MFTVLIVDRHTDPEVKLFEDRDMALAFASSEAWSRCDAPEDMEEGLTDLMRSVGWIYYACYSMEGDYVRVTDVPVTY